MLLREQIPARRNLRMTPTYARRSPEAARTRSVAMPPLLPALEEGDAPALQNEPAGCAAPDGAGPGRGMER
ncbi:hypothetical protein San01_15240 [Streptomyces angustmyceticus]|uniref:Uncharacterized protein n=1 Tax=Streptomyces angustmyceticus TaxID=285578 RepID=A0A5J4L3L9_9ACTN|nr:hypothetical protein San01_15240 [Streptomyces angustmyceticus]